MRAYGSVMFWMLSGRVQDTVTDLRDSGTHQYDLSRPPRRNLWKDVHFGYREPEGRYEHPEYGRFECT